MPSNFNMVANTDPLAAALAAAAELAQNGGAYMYSPQTTNEIVFPIAIPQSPVTETMHEDDENDDDEDADEHGNLKDFVVDDDDDEDEEFHA